MKNNASNFSIYESIYSDKTSLKRYQQFTKIKKKFWEKVASSGFNYKER